MIQKHGWGKCSLEDLGAWPCMVKGYHQQTFLDNGPFASERFPVFMFQFCSCPLVLCIRGGWEVRLWLRVQLEAKVLSSEHASAA